MRRYSGTLGGDQATYCGMFADTVSATNIMPAPIMMPTNNFSFLRHVAMIERRVSKHHTPPDAAITHVYLSREA